MWLVSENVHTCLGSLWRLTLLISSDVNMGAADWTEVEGGVTRLFQVLAHLVVHVVQLAVLAVASWILHGLCVYLLPAGGADAEHSKLSDWLVALSEGNGHQQQQIKSKLLTKV